MFVDVFLAQEVNRKNNDQHTTKVFHPPGMRIIRRNNETRDDDDGANDGGDNISCRYFPQTVLVKHCIENQENKANMDTDDIASPIKSEKKEEDI